MHILFVVPYAPNVIRTRPYNFIRQLSDMGHRITVLTLYSSTEEQADLEALAGPQITVLSEPLSGMRSVFNALSALPTPEPMQAAYCWQPALARRLETLLSPSTAAAPIDVVHVEHMRGARYALHAQSTLNQQARGGKRRTPIIWDSVDSISHLFRQAGEQSSAFLGRLITRFELPRTEHYEAWLVWQFDAVLTTSAVDRNALAHQAAAYRDGHPPIHILSNGVDLDYFRPDPAIMRDPATLVLTGKMSYHANVTMARYFVDEIMPLVWTERPDTRVLIVGKDPDRQVRALARNTAVTVTGTVPDLRPYLQQATIAVAPITYGAGIQNKVLEAMACGTPVVATSLAVRALSAVSGRDLLVGDDANDLASAILRLLDEPEQRMAMGAAGRAYVETNHNWATGARSLENLYRSLARGKQP